MDTTKTTNLNSLSSGSAMPVTQKSICSLAEIIAKYSWQPSDLQSTPYRSDEGICRDHNESIKCACEEATKFWRQLYEAHLEACTNEETIQQLRQWKEEAIAVMAPYQEIGKELGLTLGESVHDRILPALQQLRQQLAGCEAEISGHRSNMEFLTAKLWQAETDKKRLDWLFENCEPMRRFTNENELFLDREAIDEAMK
jgi:hypothetical protein